MQLIGLFLTLKMNYLKKYVIAAVFPKQLCQVIHCSADVVTYYHTEEETKKLFYDVK